MRNTILSATLLLALAAPALGQSGYPVSGRWGQSSSSAKGAIDCGGLRVIAFEGDQRTDSGGSVPAFRNRSVAAENPSLYRVVDQFSNGQVRNGKVVYTLRLVDADHLDMNIQPGGLLKLRRCK